jgi:hypothetical protein
MGKKLVSVDQSTEETAFSPNAWRTIVILGAAELIIFGVIYILW